MAVPKYDLGLVARIPAGSDWDHEFTLYLPNSTSTDAANSAVIGASDVVRFRLWRNDGETPLVTCTDQTPSANGSTVTINTRGVASTTPARVTVDLGGADTDQTPGTYRILVDVQDVSDSSRWQPACIGTLEVLSGPG